MQKRLLIFPIIAVGLSWLILYAPARADAMQVYAVLLSLYNSAFSGGAFHAGRGLFPAVRFLLLFLILSALAFTDSLFELISGEMAVVLLAIGVIFAAMSGTPPDIIFYSALAGAGFLLAINIARLGSYALGDIIAMAAIGPFFGIENTLIIGITAVIAGKLVMLAGSRLHRRAEYLNMAFVPFILLAASFCFTVSTGGQFSSPF